MKTEEYTNRPVLYFDRGQIHIATDNGAYYHEYPGNDTRKLRGSETLTGLSFTSVAVKAITAAGESYGSSYGATKCYALTDEQAAELRRANAESLAARKAAQDTDEAALRALDNSDRRPAAGRSWMRQTEYGPELGWDC